MRRVIEILSVAALVLAGPGLVAQAKPSFAGEWKKLVPGDGRGEPGMDLVITQGATSMTVEDTRRPAKLTYQLDGSASRNTIAGGAGGAPTELVSRAMWAGNSIVVTTTTGAGEEKRTFSMEGGDLVVETSAPARKGGSANVTKVTYKRYERGFGG
jgi:hypothetical protein